MLDGTRTVPDGTRTVKDLIDLLQSAAALGKT